MILVSREPAGMDDDLLLTDEAATDAPVAEWAPSTEVVNHNG